MGNYELPQMNYWINCRKMLDGSHLLIAGTTGSGKSVLLNSIIYTILADASPVSSDGCRFIFIDPKRVELSDYKDLPHTLRYCDTNEAAISALKYAISIMEYRFRIMSEKRLKFYDGTKIYIVIDELGDLMTMCKKEALPLLQRIAQVGRAAKVQLIACTQSPSREVIPAKLTLNFTNRVALRCISSIESRQIIGVAGAEELPKYGSAYHLSPDGLSLLCITMTPEEELKKRIDFWVNYQKPKKRLKLFGAKS